MNRRRNQVTLASKINVGTNTKGYFHGKSPMEIIKSIDESQLKEEESELQAKTTLYSDSQYLISKRQRKKQNKIEKAKTFGEKWFNLPATEMTEERKNDLMMVQMRSVLDRKRFYKKKTIPKSFQKYFQIGTVIGHASDPLSDRVPKKERKRTIVDELLEDAELKKWNKRNMMKR